MKPILKPLKFVGSSQDDIRDFPEAVRRAIGTELTVVQFENLGVKSCIDALSS